MSEFNILSRIFGRGAWPMINEMDGIEVIDVDAHNNSCTLILNGQEYAVKRESRRIWHVVTTGHWWIFKSQWELLAWIGDRV